MGLRIGRYLVAFVLIAAAYWLYQQDGAQWQGWDRLWMYVALFGVGWSAFRLLSAGVHH